MNSVEFRLERFAILYILFTSDSVPSFFFFFRVVAVNTQKKSHYLWKYEWVHKIYNTESFLSNFQTAVFNF